MKLKNPENAEVGKYLHTCRIKIIDEDCFPTNRYHTEIMDKMPDPRSAVEKLPSWGLLIEYFKMNFSNPTVRWGTIKAMSVMIFKNVYFVLKLFLQMFLINQILLNDDNRSEDWRITFLLLVVAVNAAPFTLAHWFD